MRFDIRYRTKFTYDSAAVKFAILKTVRFQNIPKFIIGDFNIIFIFIFSSYSMEMSHIHLLNVQIIRVFFYQAIKNTILLKIQY